jgi:hypothetical protein
VSPPSSQQPGASDLRHEHVIPRKTLRDAMEKDPARVPDILRGAIACIVTKTEHDQLTALGGDYDGWERYIAAGIDVYDEQEDRLLIKSGQIVTRAPVP